MEDFKCWEDLGIAIITRALQDYYQALMYRKFLKKENEKNDATIKECQDFFVSEDFDLYKGDRYFDKVKDVLEKKAREDARFVSMFKLIFNDKKERTPVADVNKTNMAQLKKMVENGKTMKLYGLKHFSPERANAIMDMILEIFVYDVVPQEDAYNLVEDLKKAVAKEFKKWRKKYDENKTKQVK